MNFLIADDDDKNNSKNGFSFQSFFPLLGIISYVIYMTWIGYVRFLHIQLSFYDFSSWQSIFFLIAYIVL